MSCWTPAEALTLVLTVIALTGTARSLERINRGRKQEGRKRWVAWTTPAILFVALFSLVVMGFSSRPPSG